MNLSDVEKEKLLPSDEEEQEFLLTMTTIHDIRRTGKNEIGSEQRD